MPDGPARASTRLRALLARADRVLAVLGIPTLSVMQGKLPRPLTLSEHFALGLRVAWYTFLPDQVLKTACWEFMRDFSQRGMQAWFDFQNSHADARGPRRDLTGMSQVYELEQRYSAR